MERVGKVLEELAEHYWIRRLEDWIGPIVIKHWILSLIFLIAVFSPEVLRIYRHRRVKAHSR